MAPKVTKSSEKIGKSATMTARPLYLNKYNKKCIWTSLPILPLISQLATAASDSLKWESLPLSMFLSRLNIWMDWQP